MTKHKAGRICCDRYIRPITLNSCIGCTLSICCPTNKVAETNFAPPPPHVQTTSDGYVLNSKCMYH